MMPHLQEEVEKLKQMGYREFQLQQIFREAIGKTSVDQLDEEEEKKLLCVLKQQVKFAEKCQQKVKFRK